MKRMLLAIENIIPGNIFPGNKAVSVTLFIKSFIRRNISLSVFFLFSILITADAQQIGNEQKEYDYRKVITERSAKIVNTLSITDSAKYAKLLNEIVNQYAGINTIYEVSNSNLAKIKAANTIKSELEEAEKKEQENLTNKLKQQHEQFIAHLKEVLSDEQLEKVKDGMTYRVLPITFAAYLDMLPRLTNEQKDTIYYWLQVAREQAMYAGSSEKKHAVFGRYKGKINNYLSAAGYDMKKEGEDWQKRIKERNEKTGNNNFIPS